LVSERRKASFISVAGRRIFTMASRRRDRQSPDPEEERETSRGRGRQVQNSEVERDLHNIRARLVDMEIRQKRTADIGDISESKNEDDVGHGEEEVTAEDVVNERFLKVVARMGAKAKIDIPVYEGNLDVEELLD
jgi:hypothetical protein